MINIAICDDNLDDKPITDLIADLFADRDKNYLLVRFYSGEELLQAYSETKFDIILLDYQMKDLNGIETAREIRKIDIENETFIIFISGYDYPVFDSFEVFTFRYIMKDTQLYAKLEEAILKALDILKQRKAVFQFNIYGVSNVIETKNIIYFESKARKIIMRLPDEKIEFYDSINDVENKLIHYGFCKTHNSYLVNINYVYKMDSRNVYLKNGEILPLSKNHYKDFVKAYFQYKFKGL